MLREYLKVKIHYLYTKFYSRYKWKRNNGLPLPCIWCIIIIIMAVTNEMIVVCKIFLVSFDSAFQPKCYKFQKSTNFLSSHWPLSFTPIGLVHHCPWVILFHSMITSDLELVCCFVEFNITQCQIPERWDCCIHMVSNPNLFSKLGSQFDPLELVSFVWKQKSKLKSNHWLQLHFTTPHRSKEASGKAGRGADEAIHSLSQLLDDGGCKSCPTFGHFIWMFVEKVYYVLLIEEHRN